MSVWVALEAFACLLCLPFRRRMGFLIYEVVIAGIYLLALTMVQELDYTMSIYFAFAVFPYLLKARVPGRVSLVCTVYLCLVVAVSYAMNDAVSVSSLLIIHYLGPLMLPFIFSNITAEELMPRGVKDSASTCRVAIILAMLLESAVGVLAISLSPDGRLMLNYQCVSGCISCFAMLLSIYLLRSGKSVALAEISALYFFAWAFVSGTRGYIVVACVLLVFVVLSIRDARIKFLLILGAFLFAIAAAAINSDLLLRIFEGSRFGESTGRRAWENQWFINFFSSESVVNKLIGIGIGSVFGEQPGAVFAMRGIGADDWSFAMIMGNTTMHNFWSTMILATGMLGFLAYSVILLVYLRSVRESLDRFSFAVVAAFAASYAFVLWFRWTATGSFLEVAILATFVEFSSASKRLGGEVDRGSVGGRFTKSSAFSERP